MPISPAQTTPTLPAAQQLTQLYISGTLHLISSPVGQCGEWISVDDVWHRRLDANALLLLRDHVRSAIERRRLSPEYADALDRILQIAEIGISAGCFAPEEIAEDNHAPDWYGFNSGCPKWADEY